MANPFVTWDDFVESLTFQKKIEILQFWFKH